MIQGADALFKKLLNNGYDPSIRPMFNSSSPVRTTLTQRNPHSEQRAPRPLTIRSLAALSYLARCSLCLCVQVVVDVQFRVNLLYAVDSKNEQYSLDFFVRELWTDERLVFDPALWPDSLGALRVPASKVTWKPDTFFLNAVSCSTSDNLLTLKPNGRLNWSRHQTCVFRADFRLERFPFESGMTRRTADRAQSRGPGLPLGDALR